MDGQKATALDFSGKDANVTTTGNATQVDIYNNDVQAFEVIFI